MAYRKTTITIADLGAPHDYGDIDSEGRCTRCGHVMAIGDHPKCPHGSVTTSITQDEIPGGLWLENYGPEPIKVYSHAERRRLMNQVRTDHMGRQYVLTEKETFAPMPGTDRDAQGIPNPNGYRDLSAAAILARNGRPSLDPDETKDALAGGDRLDRTDPDDIPNDPSLVDNIARPIVDNTDTPEGKDLFERLKATFEADQLNEDGRR